MQFKKTAAALLAVMLAAGPVSAVEIGALSTVAAADYGVGDYFTEGDFGYTVLEDGTLEVYGTLDSQFTLKDVVIPSEVQGKKVTSVRNSGFWNRSNMTSVTIPETVTNIGSQAFVNCSSLKTVTINGPAAIGEAAFKECKSLTTVTINGAANIGDSAFARCYALTSLTLAEGVTSIGKETFSYCSRLTGLVLPDSLTDIDCYAFSYCTGLTSVTIPDGTISILTGAFSKCSNLTAVAIPDSVLVIFAGAFDQTGLKNVYYTGTQAQWDRINIMDYNAPLINANFHYQSAMPLEIRIPLPETDAPTIGDLQAKGDVNGQPTIFWVELDTALLLPGFPDGSYTFTFYEDHCVSRAYDINVKNGRVSTPSGFIELHLLGDINGDGYVNTQDVAKANAHVKGTSPLTGYELACINVNNDANINVQDVALMNAHAKNTKKLW